MRAPLPALVTATLMLTAPVARADVQVRVDPGAGAQFAQQAGIDLSSLEMQLQTELETLFQVYRMDEYLRRLGDAQAFTTKGMGVDYASQMRFATVGIAANVSVNVEEGFVPDTRSRPPIRGVGTMVTLMGGVNLGLIGLRPLTVYGNWFARDGEQDDFAARMENWGVHGQLKLFRPGDESLLGAVVRWGGLDITSGLQKGRVQLTLSEARRVRTSIPIAAAGAQTRAQVIADSMGTFVADMRTYSVPLELTTSFRLLYLISVYGGVGFDWQFGGGSDMSVELTGDLRGVAAGQEAPLGTATITASDAQPPSAGRARGLLGAQVNLTLLRLFAHVNVVPSDPILASVALGARLVF